MIVTRVLCRKCGRLLHRIVKDAGNMREYREDVKYDVCAGHPVTAEDKLLNALFGKGK